MLVMEVESSDFPRQANKLAREGHTLFDIVASVRCNEYRRAAKFELGRRDLRNEILYCRIQGIVTPPRTIEATHWLQLRS
jgi:hypothetical protein